MEIFVHLNGAQEGPYTLEQIKALPMAPDTPVWYQGLADWTPAAAAPVTAVLFTSGGAPEAQKEAPAPPPNPQANAGNQQQASYNAYGSHNARYAPGCSEWQNTTPPKSYLAWAIISTLCCCLPLGIVAIIFATQVNSKLAAGDFDGAKKASERAQLFIILSIVLGLINAFFAPILQPSLFFGL